MTTISERKILSRWHEREQQACRDWHDKRVYRRAPITRRELVLMAVFVVLLCAVLWL